jgi:hypothetical protein
MSTPHSQPGGGDAVGRLLRSAWRYKGLIVAAVLVGALLGYGWAARQPTLYEGVSGMRMIDCPDTYLCLPFRSQARRMSSSEVLQRAVTLSGGRISAVTLGQRLEVKITPDPRLIKIRVVDSTPEGAAELANGVTLAYREVVIEQDHKVIRRLRSQMLSDLKTRLAGSTPSLPAGRTTPASANSGTPSQRSYRGSRWDSTRPSQLPESTATCSGTSPRCPSNPSSPGPVAR